MHARTHAEEASYYFNVKTGESTWEQPEELAWSRVDDT
jgi:hypothetical protein